MESLVPVDLEQKNTTKFVSHDVQKMEQTQAQENHYTEGYPPRFYKFCDSWEYFFSSLI